MTTTPRLGLTELAESQVNQEVPANEAFRALEAVGSLEILDRDATAPPGGDTDGDMYLVAATATGAWASQEGKIALFNGTSWSFITPKAGMTAFVKDEKIWIGYSSVESEWHPLQEIWSTTEHWTGKYDAAGSKIYSKSFLAITGPVASATVNTAHGITGLDTTKRVDFKNICWYQASGLYGAFPAPSAGMNHTCDGTNLVFTDITTTVDWSFFKADVRIEYCKT